MAARIRPARGCRHSTLAKYRATGRGDEREKYIVYRAASDRHEGVVLIVYTQPTRARAGAFVTSQGWTLSGEKALGLA
jgi:hypothetical protein